MRNHGGFNNNPTAKQFMTSYKRLLVHADVDISKYANNTKVDETVVLDVSAAILATKEGIDNLMQNNAQISCIEYDSINKSDQDYFFDNVWLCSDYVEDVVTYIAGFITKSVIKIYNVKYAYQL